MVAKIFSDYMIEEMSKNSTKHPEYLKSFNMAFTAEEMGNTVLYNENGVMCILRPIYTTTDAMCENNNILISPFLSRTGYWRQTDIF